MRAVMKMFHRHTTSPGHDAAPPGPHDLIVASDGQRTVEGPKSGGALRGGATPRCGRWGSPRRNAARALGVLSLALAAAWCSLAIAVSKATPDESRAATVSTTVVDRNGRLLRSYTTADGSWRLPLDSKTVDPRYLDMLVAYEDRRFRTHHGIDLLAVVRAAGQLLRHGAIVSGASTLTMQVARLLDQPDTRSLSGKWRQALMALALERRHRKSEILDLYLRLAPFGGNLEGVRAASLAYFGKEPVRLSVAERALLVAIPQSPAARRPDRKPRAARRARDRVLARAVAAGIITPDEASEARATPVPHARRLFPQLAPHLADAEVARQPQTTIHHLTVDREHQSALETLAHEHALRLGARLSVAILAVEHQTGDVIAHVGSAGYYDSDRLGAIDMTGATRSPGSTLKPFIYGVAFERGLAHPETLIEDRPARFGSYAPHNFDQDFHGTVSIREALALSLNIPAVKVLSEVGPRRLLARLRNAGATPRLPAGANPSLAVALGGVGLSLQDLATLYVALARGGDAIPLNHVTSRDRTCRAAGAGSPVTSCRPGLSRLLAPAAAWYVADILKDAPPPQSAKGQRLAFKTGTSYGYRDAWAAGFDGRYVVVVWAGRADGTPVAGLTGHGSAAPLLFDAFGRLGEKTRPLPPAPRGVVQARNADLPLPLRRFLGGAETASGEPAVAITFPPDKAELEQDPGPDRAVVLKAEGGLLPLTWLVDGTPIPAGPDSRQAVWTPGGIGFAHISVVDAQGRADRVTIRLR